MNLLLQSTAARKVLRVYVSADQSAAAGKTVAVTISKNGGAFGNPSGGATNATEIGNGWYYVDLTTTDTNTLGELIIRGTSATCDDTEKVFLVGASTNLGMTGIPNAAAGANAGLPVLSSSGTTLGYTVSTVASVTLLAANAIVTGSFAAGTTIPRVTLADTTTTNTDVTALALRIPAALVGGRMDSSVGAMAAGVIVTGTFAAGTTIPRVTLADTTTTNTDVTALALRIPAALVGGRMDSSVGAMAAGVIVTGTFAAGTTIPRVTLVDTTTTNSDMRGTDNALNAGTWLLTNAGTTTGTDTLIFSRL